jgi:hypothetical protein
MLAKLLFFSLLMVAVPLSAFSAAWQGRLDSLLEPIIGSQLLAQQRVVIAGGLGVLGVNLVVAAFVVTAWLETSPPPRQEKTD